MLPYWVFYSIPALLVLYALGRRIELTTAFWLFLGVTFALIIGFRYEVGGDWGNYLRQFDLIKADKHLLEVLAVGKDPGYVFLNWLMAKWGLVGIYGVNLLCGAMFVTGLIMFCRQQPDPLLAFAAAIPYLMIVVAMGYTRQGVALGFLLWAITYLDRGKVLQYVVLIAVASLFHKTVLVMLPFGIFLLGKGWLIRSLMILLAFYGLWSALLSEEQDTLWKNYVEVQMVSEGAKIRVLMNVLPSALLLMYWKRWKQSFPMPWLWFTMAVGSLISLALVDFASTAVDRIALYFLPIQLAVYSRLAHLPLLEDRQLDPAIVTVAIVVLYAAVLYVWLNYATHAQYWLPYQNILFL